MLSLFPDRVVLAGVAAVVLPVLSRQAQDGRDLRVGYLGAIERITAVLWRSLILVGLLAHPIVSALLGRLWLDVVPFAQILNVALLFSFPSLLQYSTLVAVGAAQRFPFVIAMQVGVIIFLISIAAEYGLHAVALSLLVGAPINTLISVSVVRRYMTFSWLQFASSLCRSLLLAVLSATGPVLVGVATGQGEKKCPFRRPFWRQVISSVGWFAGLIVSRHPLLNELSRARDYFRKALAPRSEMTL